MAQFSLNEIDMFRTWPARDILELTWFDSSHFAKRFVRSAAGLWLVVEWLISIDDKNVRFTRLATAPKWFDHLIRLSLVRSTCISTEWEEAAAAAAAEADIVTNKTIPRHCWINQLFWTPNLNSNTVKTKLRSNYISRTIANNERTYSEKAV